MRAQTIRGFFNVFFICTFLLFFCLIGPGLSASEGVEERRTVPEKLKSIEIEEVQWEEVPLSRVISTLRELSRELDPVENGGVNIVLHDPRDLNPYVTLNLRNITLGRVLEMVALYTDFFLRVENDVAILTSEMEAGERLETEIFPLSGQTLIRIIGPVNRREADDEYDDPFRQGR